MSLFVPPACEIKEKEIRTFLSEYRWPNGLKMTYMDSLRHVPVRAMVIDNTGKMNVPTGNRMQKRGPDDFVNIQVTAFDELLETARFQAEINKYTGGTMDVYFTNGRHPITLDVNIPKSYEDFEDTLHSGPNGAGGFTSAIESIVVKMSEHEEYFRKNNLKGAVIVLTDGENEELPKLLEPLRSLCVNVVIRLCTNNKKIIQKWNSTEKAKYICLDVLDDHYAEAIEIKNKNKWLNYGYPIHKFRETGLGNQLFDDIDEDKFALTQIHSFAKFIYGKEADIPQPQVSKDAFKEYLRSHPHYIFDPIASKMDHFIKVESL